MSQEEALSYYESQFGPYKKSFSCEGSLISLPSPEDLNEKLENNKLFGNFAILLGVIKVELFRASIIKNEISANLMMTEAISTLTVLLCCKLHVQEKKILALHNLLTIFCCGLNGRDSSGPGHR